MHYKRMESTRGTKRIGGCVKSHDGLLNVPLKSSKCDLNSECKEPNEMSKDSILDALTFLSIYCPTLVLYLSIPEG